MKSWRQPLQVLYATSAALRRTIRPAYVTAVAVLTLAAGPPGARAQAASDIFLLQVHSTAGRLAVDSTMRMTNRDGYSNQPTFLPDGRLVFTAIAGGTDQADIWIFDRLDWSPHPFTKTQESEYSATPIPGADRIAVIRVERDSTQRLWSFGMDGMGFKPVLEHLKPIGYQAWVDHDHVAVFVLGDDATRAPATLQLVNILDESAVTIASDIGRALQSVPGRRAVSFTRRDSAKVRWIDVYDVASKTITHAAKTLANEFHIWMPDGSLVSGAGSKMYQMMPGRDADWTEIADLSGSGVRNISRLAVNRDGSMIAIVAAH